MMKLAIAILTLWLLVFGIVMAIRWLVRKLGWGSGQARRSKPSNSSPSDWTKATVGNVRRSTRQKLMALLNGDRKTAERLLQNARFRYPGQTENWYWEKVIYDLKRDRRA